VEQQETTMHTVAYPQIDWKKFGGNFVEENLGLHHSFPTTQIEHYDHLLLFDAKRINTILLIWTEISGLRFNGVFQTKKKQEIGSSDATQSKSIDFENSEGNLGIANAIFEHLSAKCLSRLQNVI
jgi:adenylosuccinate lyase